MPMIRTLFFDVGNTLIHPYPSVGEIYSRIASGYGMTFDGQAAGAAFHQALGSRNALPLNDRRSEKAWWKGLVWDTVSSLCRPKNFDGYFDALFDYFVEAKAWRIYPDVTETLEGLRRKGITLGIISNWDSRLLPLLGNLDLARYFSVIAVSSLVGSAKPDPQIFEYALRSSSTAPDEAIHIGDSVDLDLEGARGCGIHPLLLNRSRDIPDEPGCPTIHSLSCVFSHLS